MRDKNFWLQILVSALIPTVLGGGIIFVFSQFRERLPDWAYGLIISIVYAVFIVVLFVLVVILIRLAFGDLFGKLRRWILKRAERKATQRRVGNWLEKFGQLWNLIREVVDNGWQASEAQQKAYFELHLWFRLCRTRLLPSWYSFEKLRTGPANVGTSLSTSDLEYEVFHKHYGDPFSVFYEPMALSLLEHSLRSWDKNEIKYVLQKLYDLTMEFEVWSLSRYD